MIESNKVGHSFPGGLVSKPNARSAETDVNAWRRGIIKAVKAKLKPKYAGIHLLVFAQHCRLQTIDFPFEQVVGPAIEQAGKTECERLFAGVYVFDGQPPAIFELKPPSPCLRATFLMGCLAWPGRRLAAAPIGWAAVG